MKDLTQGREGQLILRFTIPMLIGNVFQQMYNIVDSIVIGRFLGNEALAAVGASFPLIFTLISLVIGLTTGGTIIISQYFGAKQYTMVKKAIHTTYIVLFWASLLLMVLSWLLGSVVFRLIDLPEEVIPQAVRYFNFYSAGYLFFFGFQGTSAILRGVGDSTTPLYFLVVSTIMNIILDVLFVAVFNWGIEGVAVATIIAQAGAFITLVLYLNNQNELLRFRPMQMQFDWALFRKSVQIGLPTGFQQTFVALGMLALYKVVNMFGTTVIAAYTVAMRIDSFASLPAMNFSAALSSFVGQNLGGKQFERVKRGLFATLRMTTIFSLSVTVVSLLFSAPIMRMFTADEAVVAIGQDYLHIVSVFYVLFSAMFVLNGMLRGAGDTLVPMFVTLFSLWVVRVPVSFILAKHFGPLGIWWGIPIAWGLGALFSYLYYRTGRWKAKRLVQ